MLLYGRRKIQQKSLVTQGCCFPCPTDHPQSPARAGRFAAAMGGIDLTMVMATSLNICFIWQQL